MNAAVYFSLWLLKEKNMPDLWLTASFVISTLLVILLSPYFGHLIGRNHTLQKKILIALTCSTVLFSILTGSIGHTPTLLGLMITLFVFTLSNTSDLLSFFIYNTFLRSITTSAYAGTVSGIGLASQTMGSILGLLATLPLIHGTINLFGPPYLSVFIPSAIIFSLAAFPLLYFTPTPSRSSTVHPTKETVWRTLQDVWLPEYRPIAHLLLILFLLSGAVFTLQLFSAIYLERVLGATDTYKIILLSITLGSLIVGAVGGGRLSDHYARKNILLTCLLLAGVSMAGISLFIHSPLYPVLFAFLGIGIGGSFATTRALFTLAIPEQKNAQFFGLYSLAERTASMAGPLVWGTMTAFLSAQNAFHYRSAVLVLSSFLFLAAYILVQEKSPRANSRIK